MQAILRARMTCRDMKSEWIFRSVLQILKPSILVTARAAVLVLMTLISAGLWYERPALAEVTVNDRASLFYTDDVALFSATRRLNLHGDPTQPVLDTALTGKGSDMVFDPDLQVSKLINLVLGADRSLYQGPGIHLCGKSTVQPGERGAGSIARGHSQTRTALDSCR
jgi:hypothetical protein